MSDNKKPCLPCRDCSKQEEKKPCKEASFCTLTKTVTIKPDGCVVIEERLAIPDGTYTSFTVKNGCIVAVGQASLPIYTPSVCGQGGSGGGGGNQGGGGIKGKIEQIIEWVKNFLKKILGPFFAIPKFFIDLIKRIAGPIIDKIKALISQGLQLPKRIIDMIISFVTGLFNRGINFIKQIINQALGAVSGAIREFINQAIQKGMEALKEGLKNFSITSDHGYKALGKISKSGLGMSQETLVNGLKALAEILEYGLRPHGLISKKVSKNL